MEGQGQSQNDSQRVVLVHDAYGRVQMNAVKWILDGFSLKAGDVFIFLSVLHQIYHPMGYKIRVDNSMFGGANQKIIDDEIARKKKEYEENLELVQISELYETKKIDFKIELVVGPIPKHTAVEALKKFSATWVILDRLIALINWVLYRKDGYFFIFHEFKKMLMVYIARLDEVYGYFRRMKRDRKYFLEMLSCGISRVKRNDEIIKIRGSKRATVSNPKLSYGKMLPIDNQISTRGKQYEEDLFSIDLDSSCTSSTSTRTSLSDITLTLSSNQDEKIKQLSTLLEALGEDQETSPGETVDNQVQTPTMAVDKVKLDLKNCTTCNSTRPTRIWQTRSFLYSDLVDATNRFSSQNLIYRGENESIFSGTLKGSKLNVIVKEQKDLKKFKSELQALEKTRNENVMLLLGTCVEEIPRLMVFEFACNGSLDQHLSHQSTRPLTWVNRMTIAFGASRGLYHLHANNIIHGDVRTKNILLTHDFEPLLAGFGLARMNNEKQSSSDHFIIGTFGYLAPEYTERGKSTTKTDVYAFGVVLLELLTGRSPTDTRLKGQSLLKWAIPLIKERKFSALIDPEITYDNNQFMSIVQMTLNCLCKDPNIRLTMKEVMHTLDHIKDAQMDHEANWTDEIEEVNETSKTSNIDEKVNFDIGVMTPLPKQAKHFYQVAQM